MSELEDTPEGLDSFGLFLPLPYRLATVITLGVWLWGLNLWGLEQIAIVCLLVLLSRGVLKELHRLTHESKDASSLIRYQARANPPAHLSVFRFATALSVPLFSSILLFWIFFRGDAAHPATFLPNTTLFLILALFIIPSRITRVSTFFPTNGRARFLQTLRRVSVGGLAATEDGKFGDILLADALTSYARPLSEFYMALCAMITGGTVHGCSESALIPWILAVPFVIRFRQCLVDVQYANALKYATAFPAIALSVVMKTDKNYPILGFPARHLWLMAAGVNALYSFYWDVARDWDLTMLSSERSSPEHPYGLRRTRYFQDEYYYAMIAADLVLRFAWALKLSPHLEHYYDIEGGIFILELLEVVRRFLWVYFRAETEWVRSKQHLQNDLVVLSEMGPQPEDDD